MKNESISEDWKICKILTDRVEGVDGAKSKDISTTDDENAMIIKTTSLIFLYMIGNININQVEKLECWSDFPKSKYFLEENSFKADKDTKIRNGISFNKRPNIKNKPYSSGNI